MLGLSLQYHSSISQWCVYSGCSKHMESEKNKFVSLRKEKEGSAKFSNNKSAKIVGKEIVSLETNMLWQKNVLLIENMKHNMLSISQLCDQGHTLLFNS